jgi:hypothetical protein
VFLLGGITPQNSAFTGLWAGDRSGFLNSPTNPFGVSLNPATPGAAGPLQAATQAKGPFFDFDVKRVDAQGHFLDPYGGRYYYFGSKFGNDYGTWGVFAAVLNPTNQPGGFDALGGYGLMDPHAGLDGKYVQPNGYQIVSAGKDQTPGPGGQLSGMASPKWDPNTLWPGGGAYKMSPGGSDDLANFSAYVLGSDR